MAMGMATLLSRVINMIALVFLARLLEPEDFGAVALALVLFSTIRLFSGLGMQSALIHSKRDQSEIAFQAFLVTVLTSLFIFLVIVTRPSFFASLLGNPDLVPVILLLSPLILLHSLSLIPEGLLRKDLMFGKVSSASIISSFFEKGVAVGLAFLGFGLWSLVYGYLTASLISLIVLWILCPGWEWIKPKAWNRKAMKELLQYGMQSTGSGFMSFFNSNWDDWLVGRVLGSASLGFYSRAYSITNQTIAGFNRAVLSGVLFPSYAKIQDDKERLSSFYIKSLGIVALVMAPIAMGVFIIAPEMIPIVLGEKWLPMVTTLQIFAFMGLVRPLAGSTAPLFQATGHPDFNFRVGLVIAAIMVPLVFLLLNWGIEGVATAVTVSYCVGFLFNVYQVHRILPGTARKMIGAILPAIVAVGFMMIGVYLLKKPLSQLVGGEHNVISLILMIGVGAAIYITVAFLLRKSLILEAISIIRGVFEGRRKRLVLN